MVKVYLGKVSPNAKTGICDGETLYLTKHTWDCDWYWGFGYIGNVNLHTHISSLIDGQFTDINKLFQTTYLTSDDWWVLRDLFIQAYAIKDCAEAYRHGGHQSEKALPFRVIRDDELIKRLNEDLGELLNRIWKFINDKYEESHK